MTLRTKSMTAGINGAEAMARPTISAGFAQALVELAGVEGASAKRRWSSGRESTRSYCRTRTTGSAEEVLA